MATRKTVNKWNGSEVTAHSNTGELITKPNQAQTIRDILFRNTAGMSYDNYKTPYYEDQATFSSQAMNKIQDMEPTEKLQFLEQLNQSVTTLQDKIKAHEEEKAALLKAQQEKDAQLTSATSETTE
jgi:hypothetical protein